jgi:hypothetical protein
MLFTIENLKKLIFVNQNWPNDVRVDCKPLFNLVELIEKDLGYEELEEFEDSFERHDELLNI